MYCYKYTCIVLHYITCTALQTVNAPFINIPKRVVLTYVVIHKGYIACMYD